MKIGVPKETSAGERRVGLVPESVARLVKSGHEVLVEPDAGAQAGFSAAAYEAAGARPAKARGDLLREAELLVCVRPLPESDLAAVSDGAVLIGMLRPLNAPDAMRALAERGVRAFAMELVPRITRAQRMDALSSQATVAGYRAVLIAAARHSKFFPMFMTAAGDRKSTRLNSSH